MLLRSLVDDGKYPAYKEGVGRAALLVQDEGS